MKLLDFTRTISNNRLTNIDPLKQISDTGTGDGHVHNNLSHLNKLTVTDKIIKINNQPSETPLLKEDW
jgi:hypothetical protein